MAGRRRTIMKIIGAWSGHDCSFCVLKNGIPVVHAEYERYYSREKSPQGDSLGFLFDRDSKSANEAIHYASVYPKKKIKQHEESFKKAQEIIEKNKGKFHFVSHHKAHAANAFYSSNFKKSIIVTIDGGGVEDDRGGESACTIWYGDDVKLNHLQTFSPQEINIGGVWTRVTRYIFKLQNGWPLGGQEGSIMAMAALGDRAKYVDDFWKMLTVDKMMAGFKPPNQPIGAYVKGKDPIHPYLDPWAKIAEKSEQDKFDLAAGLQAATEELIRQLLEKVLTAIPDIRHMCLSGGVVLNSLAMGKIKKWFPDRLDDIYIPPIPYDGGLSIGAAQIVWHEILGHPRVEWKDNASPYLGEKWDKNHVNEVLQGCSEKIKVENCDLDDVINLLEEQKIISIFNQGSESGRRALGNRSILADPRNPDMKRIINEKVKHRQWYRPFAPSILEECVNDWFDEYQESPYMQFVLNFKKEKKNLVPAVIHVDGTARLQTVKECDNSWYYTFLKAWNEKTGVPIILNTSFNDREPICENANHALNCFLKTDIDYLYFPEHKILVSKIEK
ncbi:MAG: hypothetical protein CMB80_09065 [Flammeovirgaceae bacterium]|nr:hypothetical protein [Flammeovirgaceae bacterium]